MTTPQDEHPALAFLAVMAPGESIAFRTFDDSEAKRGWLVVNRCGQPAAILRDLTALNAKGAGVFWTVNRTDGTGVKAENITAVRALFLDFDDADPTRAERLPGMFALPPSAIIESSPGKHHVYWLVSGWPLDQFTHAQATLAAHYGTDWRVTDLPRVMRLPGFLHRKAEPFETRTLQLAGHHYEVAQVMDWLSTLTPQDAPATPLQSPPRNATGEADPYARRAMENATGRIVGAAAGNRNDTLNREAFGLYGLHLAGRLPDPTAQLERAAMAAGLDVGEIRTTLDSARSNATPRHEGLPDAHATAATATPEAPDPAPRWREVDLVNVEDAPPPLFWTDMILPAGTTTLLGAHGGTGKSFLALQWAAHLALGRTFMGLPTKRARVLFYSAEDDGDRLRYRFRKICGAMDVDPGTVAHNLKMIDATEIDPALYGQVMGPHSGRQFSTTHLYTELREAAKEYGADVVIIDNASDTYEADEVARADVRKFMRALNIMAKELGAAVLLLVHVNKATAKQRGGDSESYSGSTAWHNSARSRLALEPATSGSGDQAPTSLIMKHQKCNVGPLAPPMFLEWGQSGVIELAGQYEGAAGDDPQLCRDTDARAVLWLVHEFYTRGEWIAPGATSPSNARKMLAGQPGFPHAMKRGSDVFDLLRDMQRAGRLEAEPYRSPDRKDRERWKVTAQGMAWAGIAPTAPTAPTPEDDAEGATAHGAPRQLRQLAQGGVGGARARKDGAPTGRATVTCTTCLLFEPDTVGDGGGIGACRAGQERKQRKPLYPDAPRTCHTWTERSAPDSPNESPGTVSAA